MTINIVKIEHDVLGSYIFFLQVLVKFYTKYVFFLSDSNMQ